MVPDRTGIVCLPLQEWISSNTLPPWAVSWNWVREARENATTFLPLGTKTLVVHGQNECDIPTQLPVHEDTQFEALLKVGVSFLSWTKDLHLPAIPVCQQSILPDHPVPVSGREILLAGMCVSLWGELGCSKQDPTFKDNRNALNSQKAQTSQMQLYLETLQLVVYLLYTFDQYTNHLNVWFYQH